MSNKKIVLDDNVHNSNSSIYNTRRLKKAAKDAGDWLSNWVGGKSMFSSSSATLSGGGTEMRSAASQSAVDLSKFDPENTEGVDGAETGNEGQQPAESQD